MRTDTLIILLAVAVKQGVSRAVLLSLTAVLLFAACTKDGDTIYETDPTDAPSTAPLVTVIYDPNAVGDGNYNDLIYQGVEQAAKEYGLRTMQLSPSTRAEGLAYLQTLFDQMSTAQDTVRRLFIVAAASYDDYLRQNNDRLSANPYTDLLYLETNKPLTGKGSTLYLPYYSAMYAAGAIAQALDPEVLLVAANPIVESVAGAVSGFTDGFNADYIQYPERLNADERRRKDKCIVREFVNSINPFVVAKLYIYNSAKPMSLPITYFDIWQHICLSLIIKLF